MLSDPEVLNNITLNIRRLLEDRQWNQAVLCRRTGENHATISRVINGKQMPASGILTRIAEAFDVSIDRLVQAPPQKVLSESQK